MTTAAAPLKAEKTMTSTIGTPSTNVADREDGTEDQAAEHGDEAVVREADPFEHADAEEVAHGAAGDHDRGVVPEERDRGEHDPEDEADAPRQRRREDAV